MSVVLPNAARVHPSLWVSPRGDWRLGARLSPWSLLHRMLLGGDDAVVCRRRHESLLDRCPFGIGVGRKSDAVWSACPATCRDCLCSRRSLVTDPECLIFNVRSWHLTDIERQAPDVRFRGAGSTGRR